MSKPIIEVNGLSKRYQLGQFGFSSFRDEVERLTRRLRGKGEPAGLERPVAREFWALRDVSFAINPGEVVGVIGRNGAGKSTLLKLLSRITEPTAGEIVMRGRVASLLEVGTGFHPELSGRENVFLNGAILGMKRAEIARKFDEIVAFAEIEQFIDTPVKRYSSGMYVRLAFAVAAHLEPEILIVDEVLAVGDARFQRKCLAKIENVSEQGGRTVLFVSHSMEAIARLCPRVLVMHGGRISSDGGVQEAIDRYHALSGTGRHVEFNEWVSLADFGAEAKGARFTRFRLENTSRPGAAGLFAGEGLRAVLEIDAERAMTAQNLALLISSRSGGRLINADSGKLGREVSLRAGVQQVEVDIGQVPLAAGEYSLSLWLANTRAHQVFHSVAEKFTVHVGEAQQAAPTDKPESDGVVSVPFDIRIA